MKGIRKQTLAAVAGVVLATSLAVSSAHGQIIVRIGPPPPRPVEVAPPPPRPGVVWIAGFHRWDGARYVWVPGHYADPPRPYAHWVDGHWAHREGGWVWIEGHWR